jgi:hypothetical protein
MVDAERLHLLGREQLQQQSHALPQRPLPRRPPSHCSWVAFKSVDGLT